MMPVAQLRDIDGLGFLNLLRRAMGDEDRMAAPHHLDALADLDLADIELGGGEREHVGRRGHLADQRDQRDEAADAGCADRSNVDEITPPHSIPGSKVRSVSARIMCHG